MGVTTNIAWCHHTFNGWRGCTKVSPGCKHCYAEALSRRNPAIFGEWGPGGTRVVASEAMWRQPLAWDRAAARDGVRRRVFCGSLMDWLEDWNGPMVQADGGRVCTRLGLWPWASTTGPLPNGRQWLAMDDVRMRMLSLTSDTPNLDWLLLTKRPESWNEAIRRIAKIGPFAAAQPANHWYFGREPPSNVWLGVSVEDQSTADGRIPWLQSIPAKVRFLSVEPLLGPVTLNLEGIHWVIVGGESGPNRRDCEVAWITNVVEQCLAAGVPVFVKQDCGRQPERQGRIPGWAWAYKQVPGGTP